MGIAMPDTNLILILVIAGINLYSAIITKKTNSSMDTLEKNTNSKMDSLLDLTARASKAEGMAQGRTEERAHIDTVPVPSAAKIAAAEDPLKVEIVKVPKT